jgi:16S rRNA (adenine1518-N6/adenine1519-N6)-dimethyltransferase
LRLDGDEKLFFKVVKAGFQQRRKILNNALKSLLPTTKRAPLLLLTKRAEQLTVADFVALTKYIAIS